MNQTQPQLSDPLTALAERIRQRFPDTSIVTEEFPSGNIFLTFRTNKSCVVLEYLDQQHQYGVSRVISPEEGFVGHDQVFERLEEAEQQMVTLLSGV